MITEHELFEAIINDPHKAKLIKELGKQMFGENRWLSASWKTAENRLMVEDPRYQTELAIRLLTR